MEVDVIGDDHADGSIWVDIEGDLWTGYPNPFGGRQWFCTRRVPFQILTTPGQPDITFGPYRLVLPA